MYVVTKCLCSRRKVRWTLKSVPMKWTRVPVDICIPDNKICCWRSLLSVAVTESTEKREIMYYNQCDWLNSLFWCLLWVSRMYKCKQHIHELFWVASRFLKKIICNELYLCTRNKDGIRRILNCKCTGDFGLLCIAQRISSFISALILNMQSWLCLLCSSYFSLQQSGLESVSRAYAE